MPFQTILANALGQQKSAGSVFAIPGQPATDEDDIWATLAERVDPEAFVPSLAAGTEMKMFRMRWANDYAIDRQAGPRFALRAAALGSGAGQRMDGTQTVGELIVDRLQTDGDLDPGAVIGLVEAFAEQASSSRPRPDVRSLVQEHLDRASRDAASCGSSRGA